MSEFMTIKTVQGVGLGVFASKHLAIGTDLGVYTGREYKSLQEHEEKVLKNLPLWQALIVINYRYTKQNGTVIDPVVDWQDTNPQLTPSNLVARINEPLLGAVVNVASVEEDGKIRFKVIQAIPKGEQLFLDYETNWGQRSYSSTLYQDDGLAVYSDKFKQSAELNKVGAQLSPLFQYILFMPGENQVFATSQLSVGSCLFSSKNFYTNKTNYNAQHAFTPYGEVQKKTLRYLRSGQVVELSRDNWVASIAEPYYHEENVGWVLKEGAAHLVVKRLVKRFSPLYLDYGRWYEDRSRNNTYLMYQNSGMSVRLTHRETSRFEEKTG